VVPAVPSTISEYQASLTEILSDLKRVDFAALSRNLNATLTTANQKLQGLDTARLSEHWVKTADAIEAMVSDPEIKKAVLNLNAAGNDLRALIARLDAQVQPTSDKLAQTLDDARKALAAFDAAATGAQRFIAAPKMESARRRTRRWNNCARRRRPWSDWRTTSNDIPIRSSPVANRSNLLLRRSGERP